MKTECPNCGTIFNIVPSQMIRADKRVRCSACMTIFNSDFCLVIEKGLLAQKNRPEKPPFLQKLEQSLPLPLPLPLPLQDIPKTHHSTKQTSEEKSYYPVPIEETDSGTDEIPEFLRNYDEKNNNNGSRFVLGAIACLTLTLLLGSRSIYVFKDVLSSDYKLRPYVQLFCQYTNCQLNPLRSIQSFKLIKRNIYSHPNQKGELIISAVFKNNAAFAQIYPKIRISMSDIQGNLVAQRIFSADEYLAIPDKRISKGATATLSLNIIDPGHDALTFELEFI